MNRVFASSGDGTVTIFDGSTDAVLQTLAVGNQPQGIGFNRASLSAFVANGGDGTVSVLSVFAGSPGAESCHDVSISALAKTHRGIKNAAAAFGMPSVSSLQDAVVAHCGR
jgi:DNA-binding beta-propeller fold protein YncE